MEAQEKAPPVLYQTQSEKSWPPTISCICGMSPFFPCMLYRHAATAEGTYWPGPMPAEIAPISTDCLAPVSDLRHPRLHQFKRRPDFARASLNDSVAAAPCDISVLVVAYLGGGWSTLPAAASSILIRSDRRTARSSTLYRAERRFSASPVHATETPCHARLAIFAPLWSRECRRRP